MSSPSRDPLAALMLLAKYTRWRFDFWDLAGPASADARQEIASALAGVRVPKSKAGVTMLRAAFYDLAKPEGNCLAAREQSFIGWAEGLLGAAHAL
jgi:hypothetical protein